MEIHSSLRPVKIKTILHQPAYTYIERISPIHTPTVSKRVSRNPGTMESKKVVRVSSLGTQKSFKFKPKIDQQFDTVSRLQQTPTSRNTILGFVNEPKAHDLKVLKCEITSLKAALSQATAELSACKENYEQTVKQLENEKNSYKFEYRKLVEFVINHSQIDLKVKLEVSAIAKTSQVCCELETRNLLASIKETLHSNPFDLSQPHKSVENTARFCNLSDGPSSEISPFSIEGIVLEDFSEATDGFLQIKAGERVQVLDRHDENWWIGRLASKVGRFPRKAVLID